MAYNTGNPIGSIDARDLYDNAQNMDKAVNQTTARWTDRFGVSRPSWSGMSHYNNVGEYAAGILITGYNEVFRYDGEFYRAAAATVLPYTTTGSWSEDGPLFVPVGDAVLRHDMAYEADTYIGYYRNAINCNQYGGLEAAVADSDTLGKTIIVTDTQDVSIPLDFAGRDLAVDGGLITFSGTGTITGLKESRPEWFGTGSAAMLAFFKSIAAGGKGYLEGTYDMDALVDLSAVPLTNVDIVGVPGKSKITGSFGYGLILFGALSNVHISGIEFTSTYTNTVLSSNTAVVYSSSANIINTSIRNCKFTSPNANTQGLVLFTNTNFSAAATAYIDGLWIEDNEFTDIGTSAVTIMNRCNDADKWDKAKNIHFNRNRGTNLGSIHANYGMLISMDGWSSFVEIDNNVGNDTRGNFIEMIGSKSSQITNNRVSNATKNYMRLISIESSDKLTVTGNKADTPMKVHSTVYNTTNSYFAGNYWNTTGNVSVKAALLLYSSSYNTFVGDTFKGDNLYALVLGDATSTTENNTIVDCIFDTADSTVNLANVYYTGNGTTLNRVSGRFIKGSAVGGVYNAAAAGCNGNITGVEEAGTWTPTITFATPGDLSVTLTAAGKYTRIGDQCTVSFEIDSSAFTHSTAAGAIHIGGLPFAASGVIGDYGALGQFRGITKANYTLFTVRTVSAQSYLSIYASGSAQTPATIAAADMPTGGTVALYGSLTYTVE